MNNRYGVDVSYFTKELAILSMSLPDRTPDELWRYLIRLSEVAKPQKDSWYNEICSKCGNPIGSMATCTVCLSYNWNKINHQT